MHERKLVSDLREVPGGFWWRVTRELAVEARPDPGVGGRPEGLPRGQVSGAAEQILDAITDVPAWVRKARHDMLAANRLARALYAPMLADPHRPANNARFVYLDPAAREEFESP